MHITCKTKLCFIYVQAISQLYFRIKEMTLHLKRKIFFISAKRIVLYLYTVSMVCFYTLKEFTLYMKTNNALIRNYNFQSFLCHRNLISCSHFMLNPDYLFALTHSKKNIIYSKFTIKKIMHIKY